MFVLFFLDFFVPFNSRIYCTYFYPTEELTVPKGMSPKEAKAEIQTHPVAPRAKVNKTATEL